MNKLMLHLSIAGINQIATAVTRFTQEAALGWVTFGGFLTSPTPSPSVRLPILVCFCAYFRAQLQGDLHRDAILN
ncbi:MAG: hypothetical protein KAJ53_08750 [Anaerolineales bacterium]|nr:hypothetical protein [Anaerolineales bacterium]